MGDADEKDEVGDVEAPVDRAAETGHAQPLAILRQVGKDAEGDDTEQHGDGDVELRTGMENRLKQDVIFEQGGRLGPPGSSGHVNHPPGDRSLLV